MEHVSTQAAAGAGELGSGVGADAFTETGCAAAEEAELEVGVEAAVADPAAEVKIEAGDQVSVELGRASVRAGFGEGEQGTDLGLEFGGEDFVGIEEENPVGGAEVEGDVLLLTVASEGVVAGFCAEGLGYFQGAVA